MADPPHVSLRWGDAEPRHEPLVRRSNPVIMESIPNLSTGLEARGRVSQGRDGLTPYVLQEKEGVGIKRTWSTTFAVIRACKAELKQRREVTAGECRRLTASTDFIRDFEVFLICKRWISKITWEAANPGWLGWTPRAVVILAALYLSVVYQYLIGLLHRGGANIHSSGSLEFRSTYISIVLFQGAYVWIKSRDVAPESLEKPSPGLYRKSKVNEWGERIYYGNYEPRFKPCDSIDSYIYVGSFEEEEDGKTMYQILAFFYGKRVKGNLPLVDGGTYPIPPMTEEEQRQFLSSENYPLPPMSEENKKFLCDKRKREFVKGKAKAAFTDYKQLMVSIVSGWMEDPEIQPTRDIFNTVRPLPDCADASAGSGQMEGGGIQSAEEGYLGNQGRDALVSVSSGDCRPDVGPVPQGMQHMANDRLGEHVVGGAGHLTVPESRMRSLPETATNIPANGAAVPCEQPRELQLQHGSLQENQANNSAINVIPDDLGQVQRQVIELQRKVHRQRKESESQQQRDQLLIQEQQSQISESKSRISELERQQQLQQLRNQQQESRISELERKQQLQELRTQQQESRFSELESRISEFEGTVLERLTSTEHSRKRPLQSHSET